MPMEYIPPLEHAVVEEGRIPHWTEELSLAVQQTTNLEEPTGQEQGPFDAQINITACVIMQGTEIDYSCQGDIPTEFGVILRVYNNGYLSQEFQLTGEPEETVTRYARVEEGYNIAYIDVWSITFPDALRKSFELVLPYDPDQNLYNMTFELVKRGSKIFLALVRVNDSVLTAQKLDPMGTGNRTHFPIVFGPTKGQGILDPRVQRASQQMASEVREEGK